MEKRAKILELAFHKEDFQVAIKQNKTKEEVCSIVLVIRAMQIKIVTRCHYPTIRMAAKKMTDNAKCLEDEKLEISCTAYGDVNWQKSPGKTFSSIYIFSGMYV